MFCITIFILYHATKFLHFAMSVLKTLCSVQCRYKYSMYTLLAVKFTSLSVLMSQYEKSWIENMKKY